MAYPSKGSKREKIRKHLQTEFINKGKCLTNVNKMRLARYLMNKWPGTWSSLNAARHSVRDVMGCGGDKTRIGISDPDKLKYYGRKD